MKIILVPLVLYQGVCHRCNWGFYYPGGDVMANADDLRPLECAFCRGLSQSEMEREREARKRSFDD